MDTACLLSKQRHLDFAGGQCGFHVHQQSILGKYVGAFFFRGLDEHLRGELRLLPLLLLGVAQLLANPATS